MDQSPFRPRRRFPTHMQPLERGNLSVLILVTVSALGRKPILARHDACQTIVEAWRRASGWTVGRWVIMPDHLHLFCAPRCPDRPLAHWLRFWKAMATRKWPRSDEKPIWQRDFWDRQMRGAEHYEERWEYVRQNPVRRGLVRAAEDWPFWGEMNPLEWHDR